MENLKAIKRISNGEGDLKDKTLIESLDDKTFNLLLNELKDSIYSNEDIVLPKLDFTEDLVKLDKSINKPKKKSKKAFNYVSRRLKAIKAIKKVNKSE